MIQVVSHGGVRAKIRQTMILNGERVTVCGHHPMSMYVVLTRNVTAEKFLTASIVSETKARTLL